MLPKVLISLLALLMLSACGSSGNNLEKLHGKWQMDNQKTVELSKEFGKMSKEMKAELLGRLEQKKIVFDVFAKQVAIVFGPENSKGMVLPFQIKKDSGNTISISINGGKSIKIIFEKDNRIIINAPEYHNVWGFPEVVFTKIP